jgi:hypothetical protein
MQQRPPGLQQPRAGHSSSAQQQRAAAARSSCTQQPGAGPAPRRAPSLPLPPGSDAESSSSLLLPPWPRPCRFFCARFSRFLQGRGGVGAKAGVSFGPGCAEPVTGCARLLDRLAPALLLHGNTSARRPKRPSPRAGTPDHSPSQPAHSQPLGRRPPAHVGLPDRLPSALLLLSLSGQQARPQALQARHE